MNEKAEKLNDKEAMPGMFALLGAYLLVKFYQEFF
tara:strand:+ start:293 stop:397 length:105 start_codon:yes stop_codon:yes gene_type:complete